MSLPALQQFSEIQLNQIIDQYFEKTKQEKLIPTYSELAVEIGIDRRTLYNYRKRYTSDAFFPIIKKAVARIEAAYERAMVNGHGNIAGLIFASKNNFDWQDKQVVQTEFNAEQLEAILSTMIEAGVDPDIIDITRYNLIDHDGDDTEE